MAIINQVINLPNEKQKTPEARFTQQQAAKTKLLMRKEKYQALQQAMHKQKDGKVFVGAQTQKSKNMSLAELSKIASDVLELSQTELEIQKE